MKATTAATARVLGILAIGFAGMCAYAYPGFMSYDSFDQLHQARVGVYGDWHPPAMAALWHLCEYVVTGPFGMLVLQLVSFLAGGYLVLRRWLRPTGAAIACVALLWFPPIGTVMAVVWKDPQMFGYLLLGLGMLMSERRTTQLFGLAALALASAMRHNGFTITFALVVGSFRWSPTAAGVRRYGVATAAWLAITAAAFGANAALTDDHQHAFQATVAIGDIVGTVRYAPPMADAELREILAGTRLTVDDDIQGHMGSAFSPTSGHFAAYNKHIFAGFPSTEIEYESITRAWKELVFGHPFAYLRERWRMFRETLELSRKAPNPVWVGIGRDAPELLRGDTSEPPYDDPASWQLSLRAAARWCGATWMMRPYLYFFLVLVLAPFWIRARDRVLVAIALSALLSELALFFLVPTPDYRYSGWLVIVACIVVIALVATRARYTPRSA